MSFHTSPLVAIALASAIATPLAATANTITDFSWVPAVEGFTYSTVLDGNAFQLSSTAVPIQQFSSFQGSGALIFKATTDVDTTVSLSFGSSLAYVRLYVQNLDRQTLESLVGFSLTPTRVDGDLILAGSSVVSNFDGGQGNIFWEYPSISSISFVFVRGFIGSGLFLHEMEISPVPEPAVKYLFAVGLLFAAVHAKRRVKIPE